MAKENKTPEKENEPQTETAEETEAQAAEAGEKDEMKKLAEELAASKEAHIRTLAEYDNYRKRSTREKLAAYGDAKVDCIKELLPVIDNFERALAAEATDLESFKKGIEMTYSSFMEIVKKLGVESFGEAGEQFDPNVHNGVMHVEDEALGENVIADVFSKGYKLGDKILRPAMVKVAN